MGYKIKAPSVFKNRSIGQTLVTRSAGTKLAADGLRGRVYEVNQADLHGDESTYRKFKLVCEEVQGDNCLTSFVSSALHSPSDDKIKSRKRHMLRLPRSAQSE